MFIRLTLWLLLRVSFFLIGYPVWAVVGGHPVGAESRECFENEIKVRTVQIYFGTNEICSGVVTNSRTVRTAGHCFSLGDRTLVGIEGFDGRQLPASSIGSVRVSAPPADSGGEFPDQAEINLVQPLFDLDPVKIVNINKLSAKDRLVVVGYGTIGRPSSLNYFYGRFSEDYSISLWSGLKALYKVYRSSQESLSGSSYKGDSGGPVFRVNGCNLELVGTVSARDRDTFGEQRAYTAIRPLTDLPFFD